MYLCFKENGFVVAEYNIGSGIKRMVENSKKFNDEKYHVVRFTRTGGNVTMRVDSFASQSKKVGSKETDIKINLYFWFYNF